MVLVKNFEFFASFFFYKKIGQENVFDDILERKKKGFKTKKNLKFFNFLCKIGQENVFDNIQERKKAFLDSKITKISQQNLFDVVLESQKAFLDYKKQKFRKSRKIRIFPKGLIHGFGQKFEIFHVFIFGKINHQNVS